MTIIPLPGVADAERRIERETGIEALHRAKDILATIKATRDGLAHCAEQRSFEAQCQMLRTQMIAAASIGACDPDPACRHALRELASATDETAIVGMIDDRRLADPDAAS